MGNKWTQIARLLGRSEYWVKKHWKQLIKSEKLYPEDPRQIKEDVRMLILKLKGLNQRLQQHPGLLTEVPLPSPKLAIKEEAGLRTQEQDAGEEFKMLIQETQVSSKQFSSNMLMDMSGFPGSAASEATLRHSELGPAPGDRGGVRGRSAENIGDRGPDRDCSSRPSIYL